MPRDSRWPPESGGGLRMVARGDRVVSAYDDMSLKIWDAASGKCLMTLNGHLLTVKWVRVVE